MSQDDDRAEVRRVLDAVDAVARSEDLVGRARRLSLLLKEWPEQQKRLRVARQDAVARLSEGGMTHREIAALLDISYGRVRQIIAGETASYSKRRGRQAAPRASGGGPSSAEGTGPES